MTALAAELDGFRVVVGFVAAQGRHKKKRHCAAGEEPQDAPVALPGEINMNAPGPMPVASFSPSRKPGAEEGQERTEDEKARRNDIRKNAQIGTRISREQIDREKKKKGEQCAGREEQPAPARPIMKTPAEGKGLVGVFHGGWLRDREHAGNHSGSVGAIDAPAANYFFSPRT
jgi:hypothetical protein